MSIFLNKLNQCFFLLRPSGGTEENQGAWFCIRRKNAKFRQQFILGFGVQDFLRLAIEFQVAGS